MDTKQVIVIRKDLGMRRGKECAQSAHASMAFLTRKLKFDHSDGNGNAYHMVPIKEAAVVWMQTSFKKVCLQVASEADLLAIDAKARENGLETHLVIDSGLTEFDGIPTPTCVAIGPDFSDKIDVVTGHLKLY